MKVSTPAYLGQGRGGEFEVACESAIMRSPGRQGGRRTVRAEGAVGTSLWPEAVLRQPYALGPL